MYDVLSKGRKMKTQRVNAHIFFLFLFWLLGPKVMTKHQVNGDREDREQGRGEGGEGLLATERKRTAFGRGK